jgi:hypothetical protein
VPQIEGENVIGACADLDVVWALTCGGFAATANATAHSMANNSSERNSIGVFLLE